ncbi:uncharacterized protein CTRU02_207187 [Colletotrichum truncatum]|uniref:Uncharacterized protein n=1 Tax=Colletotrichum truncatum TaxID=5467 RepID=A0ACC3Z053_COLTU|nr:uncharacterized protein CTRU02_01182 [Colletotrichum truncatum]KAF6800777.1 hypothetical protein CTRU02_01182 [Colletotrichum truncatum]
MENSVVLCTPITIPAELINSTIYDIMVYIRNFIRVACPAGPGIILGHDLTDEQLGMEIHIPEIYLSAYLYTLIAYLQYVVGQDLTWCYT